MFLAGAFIAVGSLYAQSSDAEWQMEVAKLKETIQSDPAQAAEQAEQLIKGKNKKNVELLTAIGEAYLQADKLSEAQMYAYLFAELRLVDVGGHVRAHESRGDGIHRHPLFGHLLRQRLGQSEDRALRRRIRRLARRADLPPHGADVEDAAGLLPQHMGKGCADAVKRAVDVDGKQPVPAFGCDGVDERIIRDPGVVDEKICAGKLTLPPTTNPRVSKNFFVSSLPPILWIVFSSPAPTILRGIIHTSFPSIVLNCLHFLISS